MRDLLDELALLLKGSNMRALAVMERIELMHGGAHLADLSASVARLDSPLRAVIASNYVRSFHEPCQYCTGQGLLREAQRLRRNGSPLAADTQLYLAKAQGVDVSVRNLHIKTH
ncbi:hypothetical protein BA896_023355 [Janthinobacterium lividum]|uniref:Uncharacterized protein n=1 Tax=Janthinobacterium lividum TaxID=29581 RepID=A0A1E8PMR0_9BURK|nr:hypothetical protein BA896_023355 [Janthinobacterium lividum]